MARAGPARGVRRGPACGTAGTGPPCPQKVRAWAAGPPRLSARVAAPCRVRRWRPSCAWPGPAPRSASRWGRAVAPGAGQGMGAGRAGRCEAGRWRQAAVPEAVSNPTRNRCAAGRSCEAVGSRVGVAWAGGAGRHDEARCQHPPNKGLQATADSLRSCLASAISGA